MTRFLLDTNIMSDLIRGPNGPAAKSLARVAADQVCTSIVAAAELRFGVAKVQSASLSTRVDGLLSRLRVAPFEQPADRIYGDIRAKLEAAGRPIGANDLLIAAHALALDCILVTDNTREFEMIDGLGLENWRL